MLFVAVVFFAGKARGFQLRPCQFAGAHNEKYLEVDRWTVALTSAQAGCMQFDYAEVMQGVDFHVSCNCCRHWFKNNRPKALAQESATDLDNESGQIAYFRIVTVRR